MRKSVGTILLFWGIGVLIAQFGMMTSQVCGVTDLWIYVLAIAMIYIGVMLISPEDKEGEENEN